MSLLICADIVPTESNYRLFAEGKAEELVGAELFKMLSEADMVVMNLEVPLTDTPCPIKKAGPHLIAPTESINAFKALNVDVLSIANNHIMDQGEFGLFSTLKLLDDNEILHVGAGKTPKEAKKPLIINWNDLRVGIYSCAEHEFSISSNGGAGANPFEPLDSLGHISELKKQSDYVIVLYHGGREQYRYPTPLLQKRCRRMVDVGANLVVCQHSHCVGCEEKYNDATIVYGQGNFLFDRVDNEYWNTGLVVSLQNDLSVTYIPIKKCDNKVLLANGEVGEMIISDFNARSKEILSDCFINEKFVSLAKSSFKNQRMRLFGKVGFTFRLINKITRGRFADWYLNRKYTEESLLGIRNMIECEAHRELVLKSLERF